jgi:hypothetical protein
MREIVGSHLYISESFCFQIRKVYYVPAQFENNIKIELISKKK